MTLLVSRSCSCKHAHTHATDLLGHALESAEASVASGKATCVWDTVDLRPQDFARRDKRPSDFARKWGGEKDGNEGGAGGGVTLWGEVSS